MRSATINFLLLSVSLLVSNLTVAQSPWKHGRLHVTPDKSGLQYADGTPFFWLGDTAWELLNRLTTEEVVAYFDNRVKKGFNVIQITGLSPESFKRANRYGQQPLYDGDPLKPNEKYYARLDTIVNLALERQLVIGLVVTWGDKVVRVPGYGTDPVIFNEGNAKIFGAWMGNRYGQYANIIWILGGDVAPVSKEGDFRPVWRAMANGIVSVTGNDQLMTYHPSGYQSSSKWFHDERWLDFNMIQSSHGERDAPNWDFVASDLMRTPKKPTLDAEPNYEDHPVHPWPKWDPDSGYFRDYDVRKQLYRSVFSGAFGVTYGHHALWQFVSERDEVVNFAERGWRNALDRPGADQVRYLRYLMESHPLDGRVRDLSLIAEGQGSSKKDHAEAFYGMSHNYALIYLPIGRRVTVDASGMTGKLVKSYWFDPRTGAVAGNSPVQKSSAMTFAPPSIGPGNDWVLIIEDAKSNFPNFVSYKNERR
ncbi:MAG TPA: glycoside hydrolase family 140 protein [Chryseolinea sp.]|nr:glycoside hydrolase family 140 protein [Chryseolinea sp.]